MEATIYFLCFYKQGNIQSIVAGPSTNHEDMQEVRYKDYGNDSRYKIGEAKIEIKLSNEFN